MEPVGEIVFNKDDSYHVNGEYPVNDKTMEEKFGGNTYFLMVWTGLKDKNGREINEGDIVTTPKCSGPRVVRYDAPEFLLYKGMGEDLDTKVDCDRFSTPMVFEEVIGNIYENPELLK